MKPAKVSPRAPGIDGSQAATGGLHRDHRHLLDFCFIDADHSYRGVKSDYEVLSGACRVAMFHDIQDISTTRLCSHSGTSSCLGGWGRGGGAGARRRRWGARDRGAPPPTAHVLGQAAPGGETDEHARERARARGGPGGGGGEVVRLFTQLHLFIHSYI